MATMSNGNGDEPRLTISVFDLPVDVAYQHLAVAARRAHARQHAVTEPNWAACPAKAGESHQVDREAMLLTTAFIALAAREKTERGLLRRIMGRPLVKALGIKLGHAAGTLAAVLWLLVQHWLGGMDEQTLRARVREEIKNAAVGMHGTQGTYERGMP